MGWYGTTRYSKCFAVFGLKILYLSCLINVLTKYDGETLFTRFELRFNKYRNLLTNPNFVASQHPYYEVSNLSILYCRPTDANAIIQE